MYVFFKLFKVLRGILLRYVLLSERRFFYLSNYPLQKNVWQFDCCQRHHTWPALQSKEGYLKTKFFQPYDKMWKSVSECFYNLLKENETPCVVFFSELSNCYSFGSVLVWLSLNILSIYTIKYLTKRLHVFRNSIMHVNQYWRK